MDSLVKCHYGNSNTDCHTYETSDFIINHYLGTNMYDDITFGQPKLLHFTKGTKALIALRDQVGPTFNPRKENQVAMGNQDSSSDSLRQWQQHFKETLFVPCGDQSN